MIVHDVLVLGGGSAGFLAALTVKRRFPSMPVRLLRSKDIGIIGVGEGTTIPVVRHLHGYLGIDIAEFHRIAQPTWKLGIRFSWGPRPYFDYALSQQLDIRFPGMSKVIGYYLAETLDLGMASALMTHNRAFPRRQDGLPFMTQDSAYHIENEFLVTCLEHYAAKLGVEVLDDTVVEVKQNEGGVAGLVLESGQTVTADLYVDCSGFRAVLLGKALGEPFLSFKASLFCDRAVVGGWTRGDEPTRPYTTADTMNAGWCWQIDHENHINRGYVYSSDFIADDEAEREFRARNPKVSKTRVVKFVSGRYERSWVKNVVAIGNAAGFVEPLEATALAGLCLDAHALAEGLADSDQDVRPSMVRQYNQRCALIWETVREFLLLHYKFNTRLQTPFWKACVADLDLRGAGEFVEFYRENGPSTLFRNQLLDSRNPFGFEGYLSVMIGMNVPYKSRPPLPEHENQAFRSLYQRFQTAARHGVTVPESLNCLRQPWWQWPAKHFTNKPREVSDQSLDIVYHRLCMGS